MKVYNTLTRKKEEFKTIKENQALIYVCGPTVYDDIHIGNARPLVVFDTMRRYLLHKGKEVKFVVNFTDIDDKIINKARVQNVRFQEVSEKYINEFNEVAKKLNLYEEKTIHPKATMYIDQMIDFISGLIEKKAAYDSDDAVYFNINAAKDYGKLSGKNIEDLRAGARINVNEHKRNPMDFALWKKKKEETEPSWPSPWGEGRPGWHIECSVMAKSLLGKTIDLHAGGEDLEFPHHENEIAQTETLTEGTFANYWMHNAMITVDKEKMAKSKGNFFTLKDLAKDYDLILVRFWLLSAHYRSPIDFSEDIMEQTKNAYKRLENANEKLNRLKENSREKKSGYEKVEENEASLDNNVIEKIEGYRKEFMDSMEDDLNTSDAISHLYEIVRVINSELDETSSLDLVKKADKIFKELSDILGLVYRENEKLDSEIEALIQERNQARKDKNYRRADEIRDELKSQGIILKDTHQGVTWSRE